MILADTSAWVERDRASGSPVDLRLEQLIAEQGALATTEPVVGEMLSGAASPRRRAELRRLLGRSLLLRCLASVDFEAAAAIYRACCTRGVTPSGLMDCVIASVAMRHHAAILAADVDFARMAEVVPLDVDGASARP